MSYATISQISRRWCVDRATARAALQRAEVSPSDIHNSPRYRWIDILQKVESWPERSLEDVDVNTPLETADALADYLGVTPQTIRNYGRAGRVHRIEITPRVVRYSLQLLRK